MFVALDRWLRAVLECHAGYLTSCPDLQEMLTPLLSLMSARTALYPKVAQLRGRLELMLGELDARSGQKAESEAAAAAQMPAEALLVYQDGNFFFLSLILTISFLSVS